MCPSGVLGDLDEVFDALNKLQSLALIHLVDKCLHKVVAVWVNHEAISIAQYLLNHFSLRQKSQIAGENALQKLTTDLARCKNANATLNTIGILC